MPVFDLDAGWRGRGQSIWRRSIGTPCPVIPSPPRSSARCGTCRHREPHDRVHALAAGDARDRRSEWRPSRVLAVRRDLPRLALARFLQAAGQPLGERERPRGSESFPQWLEARLTRSVGACDFCAVHMIWGGDQTSCRRSRRIVARRARESPRLSGLASASRSTSRATLLLYRQASGGCSSAPVARVAPADSWTAFWRPWAAASSPGAEVVFMARYLFGRRGSRAAARSTTPIRRLPGSPPVRLLEAWIERHAEAADGNGGRNGHVTSERYRAYTPAPSRARSVTRSHPLRRPPLARERMCRPCSRASGYHARVLPVATRDDLLTGREVADIGQCCPTSFTTGTCHFLKGESGTDGVRRQQELRVPDGAACGACRFGQYHQS